MRFMFVALPILMCSPAVAQEVPKAMRGVWAASGNDCEAYYQNRAAPPTGDNLLVISRSEVRGRSSASVSQAGAGAFQTNGSGFEGVRMNYRLRNGHILAETIGDARAAGLFLRCAD
ncbi:hypothetical protein [Methylobacterium platani]|uniref:Elongation factor P n=3 Tax=Methylobacterium platani TaxID=427683 RepID=A0A179S4G7_9HYPH|nr:hypothetical protein [Methylobacterium platani]KMO15134.1 hypothetical protein SQ03_17725 [Methylobacterium platani JCM 14648]OAS20791.1 hypothetical protein A5481_22110 [Methylobacterium platani]